MINPQRFSEHLRFEPYKGDLYDTGYDHGVRLLVLGESHYAKRDRGADMTLHFLRRHIAGTQRAAFWTKLERAIAGPQPARRKRLAQAGE